MKNLAILFAITCTLCACSSKDDVCDMTGNRYGKMMSEGTPLTEKDKACMQAAMIKGANEYAKKTQADMEKWLADEKARTSKPTK
jgi:hypothetical protein